VQVAVASVHEPIGLSISDVADRITMTTIPVVPDAHVGQVVGKSAHAIRKASLHAPGHAIGIEKESRVVRHQPTRRVDHLNDRVVGQGGVDEVVAHDAAGVIPAAVAGVAKGDALVAVHQ